MKTTLPALATLLAGVLACSSSSQAPSTGAGATQAESFDSTAAAASSAVEQYRQAATVANSVADCRTALQQYLASIQPAVSQLGSMSGRMDDYMRGAGTSMSADMACGAQVMTGELAHHQAVACTSADMGANRAEAERHVEAMRSFTTHMEMRAVQAGGMMSQGRGGMMGGQGQMDGGQVDGGWMSGWSDGGWNQADGGMMSFDAPIAGCTFAGGGYQAPDGGYWMDGGWTMGGGGGPVTDGGAGPMMDGGAMMDRGR